MSIDPLSMLSATGRGLAGGPYAPAWDEQQVIYVGKHGNDGDTGTSPYEAKLTIQAANTQAVADGAVAGTPYVIVVLDAGIYTENVVLTAGVMLYAPTATLVGALSLPAAARVELGVHTVATAVVGVVTAGAAGDAYYRCREMTCAGTGIGVLNIVAGFDFYFTCDKLTIENGFGVGDALTNVGHTHVRIQGAHITGTGTMFLSVVGGAIRGIVDNIEEEGAGVGAGTALNVNTGTIELVVTGECEVNTMALVGNGGELHLYCPHFEGAVTLTGTGTAEIYGHALDDLTMSNTSTCRWHGDIDGNVDMNNTAALRIWGDIGTDLTVDAGTSVVQQGTAPPTGTITNNGTYQITTPRAMGMWAGPGTARTVNEYTILVTDLVPHNIDTNGGAVELNLPTAAAWIAANPDIPFVRISAVDIANAATVDPNGAETINGAALYTFITAYDSIDLYPVAGTGWVIR
jgi:hypothetical protein